MHLLLSKRKKRKHLKELNATERIILKM